jgi:hypothetical protein
MKANTRVIPVTIDPACRRVVATEAKTQTIGTIKPGMLVNAKVQKVLEDGLWIKFLGYFNGCVTWQHAVEEGQRQAKSFDTDLRNLFKPDQKVFFSAYTLSCINQSLLNTAVSSSHFIRLSG